MNIAKIIEVAKLEAERQNVELTAQTQSSTPGKAQVLLLLEQRPPRVLSVRVSDELKMEDRLG